ncbi:DUF561 domain-containing protein [Paenibacillus antri]|uniref:Probable nitronate monooxygenase n=1 Tax=Paenibacillus antri TaxID=2582848 RepID=A0A5R9GBH0_9BACL|nr:DUF561 domain-containing protein [Paenibacillus antri]TLS50063.1 DUF561 domain-containing protein [Paenibacillus antri]
MFQTEITRMLDIRHPILQAPMAGGPTTPDLAAAVSNAGGLGSIGAGYLAPDRIRDTIREIRQRTDRPFGINLFVPEQPCTSEATIAEMNDFLNSFRVELGIASNPSTPKSAESFEDQIRILLEESVPVVSFTFGMPSEDVIQALKARGTTVLGTATTVEEAQALEAAGVHAIVAQGSESGGHRGTFLKDAADALIGTMALVPQVVEHVSVPVVAAGGIMDGRGLIASLALGASAIQMGTAFLASPESGAHPAYKQKIMSSTEDCTEVTYAYSGKAARGIRTKFMEEFRNYQGAIPPYPIQNAMTRDIRQTAAQANLPEYMSLWAGQGLRLADDRSAASIIDRTIEQANDVVGMISTLGK